MSIDTNNSASTRTVVDWDDAPEGATHCIIEKNRVVWIKNDYSFWSIWSGGEWGAIGAPVGNLIERQVSERTKQLRSIEEARQIESTLAERQNQYGDFSDVAHLSQGLQSLLLVGSFSDTQQEAIQMICSKLARLACGDADHVDSWHDIAGYATLVVKDLESGK